MTRYRSASAVASLSRVVTARLDEILHAVVFAVVTAAAGVLV